MIQVDLQDLKLKCSSFSRKQCHCVEHIILNLAQFEQAKNKSVCARYCQSNLGQRLVNSRIRDEKKVKNSSSPNWSKLASSKRSRRHNSNGVHFVEKGVHTQKLWAVKVRPGKGLTSDVASTVSMLNQSKFYMWHYIKTGATCMARNPTWHLGLYGWCTSGSYMVEGTCLF